VDGTAARRIVTHRYRSALICHAGDTLNQDGMSRWLGSWSDLVLRVEIDEPKSRLVRRVRREVRRSGLTGFVDVLAFRAWYRLRHARHDAIWTDELIRDLARRFPGEVTPERLRVRSPNQPEVVQALREHKVDFVLARCKSLLKPEVIAAAPRGIFVLHPGICPEYRNAHGGFWALTRRDLDRVGTTLLRIDAGVDTGPVFGYYSAPFDEARESHLVIQDRTLFANLDEIADAMRGAVTGTRAPVDTSGRESRAWGQPRLTRYLSWKRAAKRARAGR